MVKADEAVHIHVYDDEGQISCCSLEERINRRAIANIDNSKKKKHHDHDHSHDHDHDHNHEDLGIWSFITSAVILISLLVYEHVLKLEFTTEWLKNIFYFAAYIPVAYSVIREAIEGLIKGQIFTEFFLMSLATIGAFAIKEYPEAVAVMLFYTLGELFQTHAVKNAKKNISDLIDLRVKSASVFRNNTYKDVHPETIEIGERIQVKTGESIALDGILVSENARLNNAALTGESMPQTISQKEMVMAGSINLGKLIEVQVEKDYNDSAVAKILALVENASSKKAKTELLIRRLAKIYTPFVVYLALAICFLPYLFIDEYIFSDWLYRALVFLVISCPCALVISIPLGYFGGLGAASKNGILFKGANFLDLVSKIDTLVLDKTGTLTTGVFKIDKIKTYGISERDFMSFIIAIENKSTHPIAQAVLNYKGQIDSYTVTETEEIAGKGITAKIKGEKIFIGNKKLMMHIDIDLSHLDDQIGKTIIYMSNDQALLGYIEMMDEVKSDTPKFISDLNKIGIKDIHVLSGDTEKITKNLADSLGIPTAIGDLLPEDKYNRVLELKKENKTIAFMGDGINDAPVIAVADIGIAMGAMGSDIAIETADMVIQTDQPSKLLTGIKIGRDTKAIIWQNISIALFVKGMVLILGAFGLANMWGAVFADVGVALIAILNAVRIQSKKY